MGIVKQSPWDSAFFSRHLNTYKALALLHLVALVLVGILTSLYFFCQGYPEFGITEVVSLQIV